MSFGRSSLALAVALAMIPAVENAIAESADKELIKAVQSLKLDATKDALAKGANANAILELRRGEGGMFKAPAKVNTPILFAALSNGIPEFPLLLLEKGADPKAVDSLGYTALMFSDTWFQGTYRLRAAGGTIKPLSGQHSAPLTEMLLERGADPCAKNKNGWTPLHFASSSWLPKKVELLLAKGCDPNVQDSEGYTPLMRAVALGDIDSVRLLLSKGADQKLVPPKQSFELKRHLTGEGYLKTVLQRESTGTPLPQILKRPYEPAPDQATLVFFRNKGGDGIALKPSVFLNGEQLARMQYGRYVAFRVPAAKYEINVDFTWNPIVEFEPQAGKIYYFRICDPYWRVAWQVPEEEALFGIDKLSLIDPGNTKSASNVASPSAK